MKIAIVGTAPSSAMDAPYDDKSWDIWSLGVNANRIPRFTKWFELHREDVLVAANAIDDKRKQFLNMLGKDLVVGRHNPSFPSATVYPLKEVTDLLGSYFTSSIAWMIGMAIHLGAEEIGLWGVDMTGDGEYSHQRPCCEHLLGVAKGMGIKVTVSPHSTLLRADRMYAFEHCGLSAELCYRKNETESILKKAEDGLIEAIKNKAFAEGMLAGVNDIKRRWG